MKIAPMSGISWGVDILTGRKPFPTMQKPKKGEGFKEVFDKAMEEEKNETQHRRPHIP